jgi:hypothetical protein
MKALTKKANFVVAVARELLPGNVTCVNQLKLTKKDIHPLFLHS